MRLEREQYVRQLRESQWNGLIKVVTGVRRCGKTYLLTTLFHDHLVSSGVAESRIIELSLDDWAQRSLRKPEALYEAVRSRVTDGGQYYLILDEVQLVAHFEELLNSFLRWGNVDVYVTGSNSRFLSSDVVTEFRGRGEEIRVHPLSFSEFAPAYPGNEEEAWESYVTYGGMPVVLSLTTAQKKMEYLRQLVLNVYLRDICERHRVRHAEELEELLSFVFSAIGSLVNPQKLSRTFQSVQGKRIQARTVAHYLRHFEESFLLSQSHRYDVKGKRYINTLSKYYAEDVGLRNAHLGFRQMELTHLMENIVYNELRVRGYAVDVGVVPVYGRDADGRRSQQSLEVDFVASRGGRRFYVQSALAMESPEKREQELRPFRHIPDAFRRIVITGDNFGPRMDEMGTTTIGIRRFLMRPGGLETL